jgi:hypothetical protein
MNALLSFFAGFAAGWLTRSAVASSEEAAVEAASVGLDVWRRVQRAAVIEQERFEDLLADIRSRVDERQAARGPSQAPDPGERRGRSATDGGQVAPSAGDSA